MDPTPTANRPISLPVPTGVSIGAATSERAVPPHSVSPSIALSCSVLSSLMRFGVAPAWASSHVDYWVKHPDEGSSFEKVARYVRRVPSRALLPMMQLMRYDGLICRRDDHAIAHLFFQRHGTALHMFSIWVAPELQGRGLGSKLVVAFLEWSRARSDISSVRLGAGGDQRVKSIVEKLSRNATDLGITVDEQSFVRFADRANRSSELAVGSTREVRLPRVVSGNN